jgi:uncharacterized protein DUF6916
MSSSRREFLKNGSLMALVAGIPVTFTQVASGMGITTSAAAGLDLESFESQLGTSFVINHETAKVEVRLVHVTNFASTKQIEAGKEGFSLLFRGSKEATLKQGTYLIEHKELGKFSFLIVPVGTKDTRAPHYEAVINRLHS